MNGSWAGPLPNNLPAGRRTRPWRNFLVRVDQMGVDSAARRTRHSRPRAGLSISMGQGTSAPAPTPPDIDVVGAKKPGSGPARAPDAIRKRHESATDLTFHRNNPTLGS